MAIWVYESLGFDATDECVHGVWYDDTVRYLRISVEIYSLW